MTQPHIIPSLPICHPGVSHACVTANDRFGHGVFSWHDNEFHARYNARATGGRCVPVTRDADGYPEVPRAATVALVHAGVIPVDAITGGERS